MLLHGYWRSTASYRVRIALNLKGLSYDQATHNLDLAPFPNLAAAAAHARSTKPFRAAHPDAQPDADRA